MTVTPAEALDARSSSFGNGRTALVVDDNDTSAAFIGTQLEAEGFGVLRAVSAEAAMSLAMQQPIELITLNIMLPDLGSWSFLNRAKRGSALARIPVVIVSVLADRASGFALGASAVMQKPISHRQLREALLDVGLLPLPRGGALTVLVVDDDPKAVELIAVHLMGSATTILRASGGLEAIDAARAHRPDLIVLDLMMPEVNGFQVADALHAQADTAGIPILVVTAKDVTMHERATLGGFAATLTDKVGFDRARFIAEVRRAMSGRPVAV